MNRYRADDGEVIESPIDAFELHVPQFERRYRSRTSTGLNVEPIKVKVYRRLKQCLT